MKTRKVKLGDICTVVSGATPSSKSPEYWNGDIVWITPAELSENSYVIYDSERHLTQLGVQSSSLKPFPAGTVILTSRAPIGKTAIAGREMYCNQGFKNLICSSNIYNKYLYFFLTAKTKYLNSLGRGATFKELSKKIVENIEIDLPEINIQKHRAEILLKILYIIQKKKIQLQKLDSLIKSRFVEMFGDPDKNPFNWNLLKIGSLIDSCEAGWSCNGYQRKKGPGEIAVLKVSSITKGYFIPSECKVIEDKSSIKKYIFPQTGDLLFSRANTRDLVGATAVITKDYPEYILPDKLWRIKFIKNINVWYIKYILSSKSIRSFLSSISTGTSGSMFNISMKKFKSIVIPVPPIELQNQFAAFVQQVDKSKFLCQFTLQKFADILFAQRRHLYG